MFNLIQDGPLETGRLLKLGIQIAGALAAAHHKGVVHRDIKPANVYVTSSGQVKLLDFGLAKLTETSHSAQGTPTRLTADGVTVGTPYYMSPEQLLDQELDARSDIFSFGVLLYEAATNTLPFTGRDIKVVFNKILNSEAPLLISLNPDLPPELERLIHKCLEKDRDVRYQSAADLEADLKRIQRKEASILSKATTAGKHLMDSATDSGRPGDVHSETPFILAILKGYPVLSPRPWHRRVSAPGWIDHQNWSC